MKNFDIKRLTPIIYVLSVLLLLIIAFKVMIFLLPFVIGMFIVLIVEPVINFLKNKFKLKNYIIEPLILILFYLLVIIIFILTILNIIHEVYNFTMYILNNEKEIINYIDGVSDFLNEYITILPKFSTDFINSNIERAITYFSSLSLKIFNSGFEFIKKIPYIMIFSFITIIASFIIQKDRKKILVFFDKQMPKSWTNKARIIKKDVLKMILIYLKAQFILINLCFFETLIGLNIINFLTNKIEYTLVMSFAVAVIDALPVFGAGTVMLPWALFEILVKKEYMLAFFLFCLYLIILVVRQYSEPKLISKDAGVHPLLTLVALYSGFKIFGVLGFLYGPIIMAIIRIVFYDEFEYGFFKYLINEKKEEENEKDIKPI